MSVTHDAGGSAGFTLLELLVAITLLALLSLVLVSGLRIGTHIWNRTENTSLGENAVRGAQRLLAQDLNRLYPRFVSQNATDGFIDFDGAPTQLAFISTAGQKSGSLKRVMVSTSPDRDGAALQYIATAELAPSVVLDVRTLLHHVKSLSFSYFGFDDHARQPSWHTTWQHKRTVPILISIRVTTKDVASGTWPELVVRPHIVADVSCAFDVFTKFCLGR